MNELLITILEEFYDKLAKTTHSIHRDYSFAAIKDKIRVAIGMRRCGKTYFLFQTIKKLLNNGIDRDQILYINFEDDRLLPCDQAKLASLLEAFYTLYPINHDRKCYMFLDEIQNVADWALVVRRFQDSKDLEIYLSGASSKLLSKDLHTALRGRSISLEIWPLSFPEYLSAVSYDLPKTPFTKRTLDQLLEHFAKYLAQGGFPGTTNIDSIDRTQILQEYVELVIIKDIVERYNVENIILLKYLLQTILKNVASHFSASKFTKDIKSQGIRGAKNSILEYLEYLEDAYLIFPVKLYSESVRQVQTNTRKMYAVDPGLVNAYTFSKHASYGHLFENVFYLWLRRSRHKIFYYLTLQDRYEVDFLTQSPDGELHLYQVCWDISETQTLERELRALEIAKKELNIEGTLITPDVFFRHCLS